jgi:cytochrome c peroxidase
MLGDWARVPRMTKKAAIVIAAVALLFGAAGSLFGAPQAGLAALKRQYWRPATIPYPAENPYGRAKEELGRALFFDPILSGARVRSCASCHNPGLSWGDGEPRAIGENQVRLPLRSPKAAQYRLGSEARMGRALPRPGKRRHGPDHRPEQYEFAGTGAD